MKLRDVTGNEPRIQRDRPGLAVQGGGTLLRQAAAQAGKRLAEAGAGELRVGFLPQQPRQAVPRVGVARREREKPQQGLGLAGGDADLAARGRSQPHAAEQFDVQFGHGSAPMHPPSAASLGPQGDFHAFFTSVETTR